MMFFFKGRSVVVRSPTAKQPEPERSIAQAQWNEARARLKREDADSSGALRRDRQTIEDNSLL